MKKLVSLTIILLFIISLTSCTKNAESLVGNSYNIDGWHVIEFKSSSSYRIYQKPHNCGGSGSWSVRDGKVIIGSNDSNCESTRGLRGSYSFSNF